MPKKKEPVIVTETPIKIVTEQSDDEIEAVSKKKVYSPAVETDRRKKGNNIRSEAQKLAFEKAKLARQQKRDERKKLKELEEEALKKEMEDKIIQKAVAIKKKQLKKQTIIDEYSGDETPVEELKKMIHKKLPSKPSPIVKLNLPSVVYI